MIANVCTWIRFHHSSSQMLFSIHWLRPTTHRYDIQCTKIIHIHCPRIEPWTRYITGNVLFTYLRRAKVGLVQILPVSSCIALYQSLDNFVNMRNKKFCFKFRVALPSGSAIYIYIHKYSPLTSTAIRKCALRLWECVNELYWKRMIRVFFIFFRERRFLNPPSPPPPPYGSLPQLFDSLLRQTTNIDL